MLLASNCNALPPPPLQLPRIQRLPKFPRSHLHHRFFLRTGGTGGGFFVILLILAVVATNDYDLFGGMMEGKGDGRFRLI